MCNFFFAIFFVYIIFYYNYLFVGKGRFGSNVIRRTASLDTLYHKGQWPRDYYLHAGQLQVDKSTQVSVFWLY